MSTIIIEVESDSIEKKRKDGESIYDYYKRLKKSITELTGLEVISINGIISEEIID